MTAMELSDAVMTRLRALEVDIERHGDDTLVLRRLPVCPSLFNKEHTNVLIKRTGNRSPFVVAVDEDLEYRGADGPLARLFAKAAKREGWRILLVQPGGAEKHLNDAVESILRALGETGTMPIPAAAPRDADDRDTFPVAGAVNLTALERAGDPPPVTGRAAEIEEIAACLLRLTETRMPLLTGAAGIGKTAVLRGAAKLLSSRRPECSLYAVDLGKLFAGTFLESERSALLAQTLEAAAADPRRIVALEHVELAVLQTNYGVYLVSDALDNGARLAATAFPEHLPEMLVEPLARRLCPIEIREMGATDSLHALEMWKERIAAHHSVDIDGHCLGASVAAAKRLEGYYPAKALSLLDAAAARASLAGTQVTGPEDVYYAARGFMVDDGV